MQRNRRAKVARRLVFLLVAAALLLVATPASQATHGGSLQLGHAASAGVNTASATTWLKVSTARERVLALDGGSRSLDALNGIFTQSTDRDPALFGDHAGPMFGFGVWGRTGNGVGVRAENTGRGNALRVWGPASFSRSGVLTVPIGATTATKTAIPLTASSFVLATLQTNAAGLYVQGAVPNPAAKSFTVHFSRAAPAGTKVAWIVMD
jgi:hypothetical protein